MSGCLLLGSLPADDFLGKQGPTCAVDVDNEDSPFDFLNAIFTDEFLQIIVEET